MGGGVYEHVVGGGVGVDTVSTAPRPPAHNNTYLGENVSSAGVERPCSGEYLHISKILMYR